MARQAKLFEYVASRSTSNQKQTDVADELPAKSINYGQASNSNSITVQSTTGPTTVVINFEKHTSDRSEID